MSHPVLHLRGVLLPEETERDIWICDGRISFTPMPDATTIATAGYILPGFIDAHCHVGLGPGGAVEDPVILIQQAELDRDAGALLLRDAGSPVDNRIIQQRDDLPRLVRAGRHIARSKRYLRDVGVDAEPEDLVAEVQRQVAFGDGWVKLAADWIDRSVGDLAPVWPDDVLAQAVARAHELGARVAAHVFGEDALPGLIAAGIDSIEHGTGLTDDLLDEVARRNIAVVPTVLNVDTFPGHAAEGEAKFPAYARHMRALHATSAQRLRNIYDAGIAIYPGTDAGSSLPHGLIRAELAAMVNAGLPQAEVVAQASWRGRAWLGRPWQDDSGIIDGADADLLVFSQDPRTSLEALGSPAGAVHTILRGAVIG